MYSQKMTLIVGCTADFVLSETAGYSTSESMVIGAPNTDIYTIFAATVSPTAPSYCPINYSVVQLLKDGGAATGSEIGFAASCGATLPCLKLDLANTATAYVLTFKIRATLGTSVNTLDSSLITISVVSCLTLNSII